MLYVILGTGAGKTREEIMTIYPRHKAFLDQFIARAKWLALARLPTHKAAIWQFFETKRQPKCFASPIRFCLKA